MRTLEDIAEEYEFLEGDERYRLLIELGRELDPMPDALKTDATLVRGCSASVWVYPTGETDKLQHHQQCGDHQGHCRTGDCSRAGQACR